jgi:hypothetical protein
MRRANQSDPASPGFLQSPPGLLKYPPNYIISLHPPPLGETLFKMGLSPIQLAVFSCPLIADGLLYLEDVWSSVPVTISRKMASVAIHADCFAEISVTSTSSFAHAALQISPLTYCGSISYPQVPRGQYFADTFAFRPLCFQDFTSIGGGGGVPNYRTFDLALRMRIS